MGQSGRSQGVKVDGPKVRKWTVMSQTGRSKKAKSGRSAKVDGPKIQKWTVLKAKTGRSFAIKLDGPKGRNWTVILNESGRSFGVSLNENGRSSRIKVDGLQE